MAIRALRVETENGRRCRIKTEMKLRNCRMARQTKLGDTLMIQQVPVWRTMRTVTGGAPFNSRCWMFEYKRAAFIVVALGTGLLFEAAEQAPRHRFVRIVAVDAFQHALAQAMPLVEFEHRQRFLMTADAKLARGTEPVEQDCGPANVSQQ